MIADQAARWRREGQARLAAARRTHVGHLRLAHRHLVDDRAGELVVDVDYDGLIRLLAAVRAVAEKDARTADAELKPFTAKRLDEHAQLQLAAACDFIGLAARGLGDADGDIALGFAQQAIANDAALHLVAVLAGKRAVVDRKRHAERRRVDLARVNRRRDQGSAIVLETVALMRPAMAMMSPAAACSTGTLSSPRKANNLVARPSSTSLPPTSIARIGSLTRTVPLSTRP